MKRSIRNRNSIHIDTPFDVSQPSSSTKEHKFNYCPITKDQNQQSPEIQQLLEELNRLDNRKTQIYERLNQLGFN